MSRISTARASYQRLGHISLGHRSRPNRAASQKEANQVRNAISDLNAALAATTDTTLNYRLSQAYRGLYSILKERNNH